MTIVIKSTSMETFEGNQFWSCELEIEQAGTTWMLPATAPSSLDETVLQAYFEGKENWLWVLADKKRYEGVYQKAWFGLSKGRLIQHKQVVTKTAAYTATMSDEVILCDASSGTFTITLPASLRNVGVSYHIKKIDSSANAVTVDADASETIDDALTAVLASQYDSVHLVCDGSAWHIV